MVSIYGLKDKRTGKLRYIGKANDPERRMKTHMRDAQRRDTPVCRWLRKHGEPEMVILVANCDDWKADERRLIAEHRQKGDRLLNVADGGDQPKCSRDQLMKAAKAMNARAPQHVKRAYRVMESNIRCLRRLGRDVSGLESKYEAFKESIDRARNEGRLDAVNDALGVKWAASKVDLFRLREVAYG